MDAVRPLPAAAGRRLNVQLAVEWIYNFLLSLRF